MRGSMRSLWGPAIMTEGGHFLVFNALLLGRQLLTVSR